jgi:hypothetical protein
MDGNGCRAAFKDSEEWIMGIDARPWLTNYCHLSLDDCYFSSPSGWRGLSCDSLGATGLRVNPVGVFNARPPRFGYSVRDDQYPPSRFHPATKASFAGRVKTMGLPRGLKADLQEIASAFTPHFGANFRADEFQIRMRPWVAA